MKKYEPIGDRVLLSCPREDVNGHILRDGILVPEGESRKINPIIEMMVEAAGPDCKQVEVGDICLYNIHNSPAQPRGDVELRWVQEPHIIAIVRRESAMVATD